MARKGRVEAALKGMHPQTPYLQQLRILCINFSLDIQDSHVYARNKQIDGV